MKRLPDLPPPESLDEAELLLRQRDSLRQIVTSITRGTELRPLLSEIFGLTCQVLRIERGLLGLYHADADLIRIEAVFNARPQEIGLELRRGTGISGRVLETGAPVILSRYGELQVMAAPDLADQAGLGVPITWRNRLIGTMAMTAPAPRRFTADDVALASLYAGYAAIAIHESRQHHQEMERNTRLQLLARIGRTFAAGLQLDALCESAVEVIHQLMGYPNVSIGLLDSLDPQTIVLKHHGGGFRGVVPERRIHVSQGVMGAAVRERRIQRSNDVTRDPRYIPIPGLTGIRSEIAVPLLLGPAVLGILNVESPRPLTDDDAANLQTIADNLSAAISNARRFEDAQRVAVLEERHRLARDLHDSITQMVFSASLMAQSLPTTWKRDAAEGERLAERVVGVTRSALTELRALLHELRPSVTVQEPVEGTPEMVRLRREGLASLVRSETKRMTGETLATELDLVRYRPQPFEHEEALYRVFQEALYNVTKHARATWVRILLACENGEVVLQVTDDGVGFDPERSAAAKRPPGLGRGMMAERVTRLGGVLRTSSEPGSGASVEARVPSGESAR
jgi:signal transduction histidine kinase